MAWSEAIASVFQTALVLLGWKTTAEDNKKSDEAKLDKQTGGLPDPTPPKPKE